MDRIVLAVDGSEHSQRAAAFAGELSARNSALVDIINVVPDQAGVVAGGAFHEYARLEKVQLSQRELLESMGQEVLARCRVIVTDLGGKVDMTRVLIGPPANCIARFAEDVGADCIVMGRRGLGDLRGLFMGSVSHRVGTLTDITLITTQ